MARFTGGWIPWLRSVNSPDDSNPYHGDGLLIALRTLAISWAATADSTAYRWGQTIEVKAGDFLTSYEEIAEHLGCSVKQARRLVDKAKRPEIGLLGSRTGRHGQIITVVNYNSICYPEKEKGRQTGKLWAGSGQAEGTIWNKSNNKNKKNSAALGPSFSLLRRKDGRDKPSEVQETETQPKIKGAPT